MSEHHRPSALLLLLVAALTAVALPASANALDKYVYLSLVLTSLANAQITYIYYDGLAPRVESDEYTEIANLGSSAVNLDGWILNVGDPGQDFIFLPYDLQPGQSCWIIPVKTIPSLAVLTSFTAGLFGTTSETAAIFTTTAVPKSLPIVTDDGAMIASVT